MTSLPSPNLQPTAVFPSDRDRILLAFADLARYGIAARPAARMHPDAIGTELRNRHRGGLGSYVCWRAQDDHTFDPAGRLLAPLPLYCSGPESVKAAVAACTTMGLRTRRAGVARLFVLDDAAPAG